MEYEQPLMMDTDWLFLMTSRDCCLDLPSGTFNYAAALTLVNLFLAEMACKIHIPQSYFRRLRKWCSRQARRFWRTSRVADDEVNHYKETQRKVLASSSFNGSQKPTLDLKGFLTPTPGDYNIGPRAGVCGCGAPAGQHPLLPSRSAHAAQTCSELPPTSSQSATEVKDMVEVSSLPECRYSILGHFHQGHIPEVWSP